MKAIRLLCTATLASATVLTGIQAENPSGLAPLKLPAGMFSTLGNQIVDKNQNPVRLSCVYWLGMNTKDGHLIDLEGPFKGIRRISML